MERLEEAVAAYRAALEERTRERVPLDWAATQSNLGDALTNLGWRESGTERLEEAVTAFRAALEERKRPDGASAEEIGTAMDWQRHTVRGFIAGAVKKKLGLAVTATKVEARGTVYSIAADA